MPDSTSPSHRPWTSRFAWLHPRAYLGLHITLGLLLSGSCTWAFVAMAEAVTRRSEMAASDHRLAEWVEQHNSEAGEQIALAISLFGNEILWVILTVALVVCLTKRAWRRAALLVAGASGGYVLNAALKTYFHRVRPVYSSEFKVDASSFPSGHAMAAIIGYGMLAYLLGEHVHDHQRRAAIIVATVAVVAVIAAARVYLNVHFLSDVFGGLAAGGLWLSVCVTAYAFARRRHLAE